MNEFMNAIAQKLPSDEVYYALFETEKTENGLIEHMVLANKYIEPIDNVLMPIVYEEVKKFRESDSSVLKELIQTDIMLNHSLPLVLITICMKKGYKDDMFTHRKGKLDYVFKRRDDDDYTHEEPIEVVEIKD